MPWSSVPRGSVAVGVGLGASRHKSLATQMSATSEEAEEHSDVQLAAKFAEAEARIFSNLVGRLSNLVGRLETIEQRVARLEGRRRRKEDVYGAAAAAATIELADMSDSGRKSVRRSRASTVAGRLRRSSREEVEKEVLSMVNVVDLDPDADPDSSIRAVEDDVKGRINVQDQAFLLSVWELCILLGVNGMSVFNSGLIAICLLLNVVAQTLFCTVLYTRLVGESYPEVASFRQWRGMVGHHVSTVDDASWTSMATRLCARDDSLAMSATQRNMLDNMENYLATIMGALPTGGALVCVAILVWFLSVAKEIWRAVQFMQALHELPRTKSTILTRCDDTENLEVEITSLSVGRFVFMEAISIMRIVIAVSLLILGSIWLAETTEVGEIVVNAVAMQFVLDVDELLFDTGIPLTTRVLYQTIRPLTRKTRLIGGVDVPPVLNMSLCAVFISVIFAWRTHPMMRDMGNMGDNLCSGNQQFVVGMQPSTKMILSTQTKPYSSREGTLQQSIWMGAVQELIDMNLSSSEPPVLSQWVEDRTLFQLMLGASVTDLAARTFDCEDFLYTKNDWRPIQSTLRLALGLPNATFCGDFAAFCDAEGSVLLRLSCPVTCGCRSPRSGLLLDGEAHGCPRHACQAHEAYQAELGRLECRDLSTAELIGLDSWRELLGQVHQLEADVAGKGNITAVLESSGCAALRDDGENGTIDFFGLFCKDLQRGHRTLHAFCPISCGCERSMASEASSRCPMACSRSAATSHDFLSFSQ